MKKLIIKTDNNWNSFIEKYSYSDYFVYNNKYYSRYNIDQLKKPGYPFILIANEITGSDCDKGDIIHIFFIPKNDLNDIIDDDLKVGDEVVPKDSGINMHETPDWVRIDGKQRGDLRGYNPFEIVTRRYGGIIAEITYDSRDRKVIRFEKEWPYYLSSEWIKRKK